MIDIVGLLVLLISLVFTIIGICKLIKQKNRLLEITQLKLNFPSSIASIAMIVLGGGTMTILFGLNVLNGFVNIEAVRGFGSIIKGLPFHLFVAFYEEIIVRIFIFIGILAVINNRVVA